MGTQKLRTPTPKCSGRRKPRKQGGAAQHAQTQLAFDGRRDSARKTFAGGLEKSSAARITLSVAVRLTLQRGNACMFFPLRPKRSHD
jgi:hypothetical protein